MKRLALAQIAASAFLLLGAQGAQAEFDPVGSGTAKLTLDKGFAGFLRQDRVQLLPRDGGVKRGQTYALPVSGGVVDPTIGQGTIEVGGTLSFQSSRNRVPLRGIVVKNKPTPLIARVGGSQLKVAAGAGRSFKRVGFDAVLSVRQLKLTAKVATRLNKKLRPKLPFTEGQIIGRLVTTGTPATVTVLPQGGAGLQLSDAFVSKLNGLFVSANPIFPAEHQGASFTFPFIPGGTLSPAGTSGTVRTGGSIEFLQLPSNGQIVWHELYFDFASLLLSGDVDIEPSPPHRGKVGRMTIASLSPGFPVVDDPAARSVGIAGVNLTLQPDAAAAMNDVYAEGAETFKAGEALGTLSFSATGQ